MTSNKELNKYDPLDCAYCEYENVKPKSVNKDKCVEYECPNCDEIWVIDADGDLVE